MEQDTKQKLKEILLVNENLRERLENDPWSISYNKKADMVLMGTKFPIGSFYYPVGGTGVMLRIDENNKLYGFAIENTKSFIKENPEMAIVLSLIVYPVRSFFILCLYFFTYHAIKRFDNIKRILSIGDYVAGKASFV
mgnify:FL=1